MTTSRRVSALPCITLARFTSQIAAAPQTANKAIRMTIPCQVGGVREIGICRRTTVP